MKIYIRADWYDEEIEPFLSADPYENSTGYSDYDEYELYDYSEYEDFYHQIFRRKIFVPLKVVKDIPDYNAYRKALFNTLYLSMQSGESIETLYSELSSAFPGIIKEDANNRADMLIEIVDATLYAQSLVSPISASKGDMYMKRYVKAGKSDNHIERLRRWGFTDEEIRKFSKEEIEEMIKSADEPLPPDLEEQIYSEFSARDAEDICALIEMGHSVDSAIQTVLGD